MKTNKLLGVLLSVVLIFAQLAPIISFAEDDGGKTIVISSAVDFVKFSRNCTLDSWSKGKTFVLESDIDLTNVGFSPVPTFAGTFLGNGHTISGIKYEGSGSYIGLFRYVQSGAEVRDLNIAAAEINPSGSKCFVGGITGENSGTIRNCSFGGNISGEDVVGGIAGRNTESGTITSCKVSGKVMGENSVGGIAGKNQGKIIGCHNSAEVNTEYAEKKNSITSINTDIGSIVETFRNAEDEKEEDSVLGNSDAGGIAGVSTGYILNCTNGGAVGYPHIGYNVGGIAGRQSGYVEGCRNYGFIQGRKDVGGIVGQMEPNITLNDYGKTLDELMSDLDDLQNMVDKLISDSEDISDDAKVHLDGISEYAKTARDATKTILDETSDFVDDNIDEINEQADIIKDAIDSFEGVFDDLEGGTEELSDALDVLADSLDEIEISSPDLKDEVTAMTDAIREISTAQQKMRKASNKAVKAIDELEDAVYIKNKSKLEKAAKGLSSSISDIADAGKSIKNTVADIEKALSGKPESLEEIGIDVSILLDGVRNIRKYMESSVSSLEDAAIFADTIVNNIDIDLDSFEDAAENTKSAIGYLDDGLYELSSTLTNLADAADVFSDAAHDYTDDLSDDITKLRDALTTAGDSVSSATDKISSAFGKAEDIIKDLSEKDAPSFVKPADDFDEKRDDLFDSISDISDELSALKESVYDGRDKINSNVSAISDKFNSILDSVIKEIEGMQKEDASDIFLDVSDENVENAVDGKVKSCTNSGRIEADHNAGGIAGAMAIEYAKDPEDDIKKPDTFNFIYRTKAILQSCENSGNVVGKKDSMGGIVGLSELGTVYECTNYAPIESTLGNYVGGIVGKSGSTVRGCLSKCTVTGKKYVGGIAGKADTLAYCYSVSSVYGDEIIGAICGKCDSLDKIFKNYYVDKGLGAIYGISYSDKAEPISIEQLSESKNIPLSFTNLFITFKADDMVIESRYVEYGSSTALIDYPGIPEKYGYFGKWQKPDSNTVTEDMEIICEYYPYITVLSSKEKTSDGLARLLAEGRYTDDVDLHIKESGTLIPEDKENTFVYDVSITGADIGENDEVTLRLLKTSDRKAALFVKSGDGWEKLSYSVRGQYLIFTVKGAENTICIEYEKGRINLAYLLLIIPVILIVAVIILLIKKSKKRKKKKPSGKSKGKKEEPESVPAP